MPIIQRWIYWKIRPLGSENISAKLTGKKCEKTMGKCEEEILRKMKQKGRLKL